MFAKILVPLDGSDAANRALAYAQELAVKGQTRVVLLRAVEPWSFDPADRAEAVSRSLREAQEATALLREAFRGRGISAECHICVDEAVTAIVRAAATEQADLIVMSSRARDGLGRFSCGSVTLEVVGLTNVPVLLVSPNCGPEWVRPEPATVLVPLDGSALAESALPPALHLADLLGARLTLLRAVSPRHRLGVEGVTDGFADPEAWLEEANLYLKEVASRDELRRRGATVMAKLGHPAPTLADAAAETHACAIVMTAHGWTGQSPIIVGGVLAGVLQRVSAPTLIVRPKACRTSVARIEHAGVAVQLAPDELRAIRKGLRLLARAEMDSRRATLLRRLSDRLTAASAADYAL